jgi:hypothetical protein
LRSQRNQRRERTSERSKNSNTGAFFVEVIELFIKGWPVILAIITLIIVLAKLDLRVAVLEDKVKTLFDLINRNKS